MGVTDNKTITGGVSFKQILGIVAVFVLCAVVIYFDALVVGYVVATLALCAFFLVVAFDVGVQPTAARRGTETVVETPREPVRQQARGRTAREL